MGVRATRCALPGCAADVEQAGDESVRRYCSAAHEQPVIGAMPGDRPQRPTSGWRGAIYVASAGLINPGVGESEATQDALLNRIRRPLRGGLEIAVTSMKGGVGKTTVTACLGLTLAEHRGDRVITLDANPDAGTLADRLTGEVGMTMRQMLDNIEDIRSLTDVSRYTSEIGRLHVIASEQDPAISEAFNRAEYERICGVLTRYYDILITDSGTGMVHSAMEGTLARAGALIVVGTPTVDGSSRASKTLDWLDAHGFAQLTRDAIVVLSGDRASEQIDRERIRAHFDNRCRAVVEIPYDPHLAVGGRIDPEALRGPVRDAFLTLGALLVDAYGGPPPVQDSDWNKPSTPPRAPLPAVSSRPSRPARRRSTSSKVRIVVTVVTVFALLVGVVTGIALFTGSDTAPAPEVTAIVPPPVDAAAPPPAKPAAPPAKPAPPPTADMEAVPSVPVPSLGAPIPVGPTPGFVAVAPNGRLAYVANRDAKVITVVDTSIDQVTATIPVDAGPPQFLTFSPDGRRVYVSIFNQERTIRSVGVLDTITNKIIANVPVQTRPYVAALTPDGRRLYVPNHDSGTVSVLDTASNTIIKEIKVAANPHCIEFSRDGTRAYTANHESNLISVLDTSTDRVMAEIRVQTSPHSVAVHPTLPLVANVNYDSNSVSMIDTTANRVIANVPVGKNPQDITWAPDGRFAYVANVGDGTVSVIDNDTKRVTATIPTGQSPTSVAVLPNGRTGYVTNLDSGTLSTLRLGG